MSASRAAAAIGVLAAAAACATNPVTGGRELALMTEGQELSIGRDADEQIREQMGVYDSPALQRTLRISATAWRRSRTAPICRGSS